MTALQEQLVSGLESLNLPMIPAQTQRLIDFITLLAKWNKTYNLTAIRTPEGMVNQHLLDSLAIAPYVQGLRVIDVGTGAGIPGIPLAIALPDKAFVLLDSNAKKTRFIQQVILELKLTNVTVCHQRVENYLPDRRFDTVITRAFASLADIVSLCAHLSTQNGIMLAMKGQNPEQELSQLQPDIKAAVIPIAIPKTDSQRCLVKLTLSTER